MIEALARKAKKRGVTVWRIGASRDIRCVLLLTQYLKKPLVRYAATVELALAAIRKDAARGPSTT